MLPRAIHRPIHQPARPSLPLIAPLTAPTTGAEEIAERCRACTPNPAVLYGGLAGAAGCACEVSAYVRSHHLSSQQFVGIPWHLWWHMARSHVICGQSARCVEHGRGTVQVNHAGGRYSYATIAQETLQGCSARGVRIARMFCQYWCGRVNTT